MDTSVIGTLNTCFWVCLSFTVLFFIISIILFFAFDIKTIFNIKTGRAQTKTIKEMKAANESTGRLRVDGKTQTTKLTEKEKDESRAPAVVPPEPEVRNQFYNGGSEDTEILPQPDIPKPQYGNTDFAETSVLSENMIDYSDNSGFAEKTGNINFRIVKKVIYIHTNEVI